MQLNQRNLGALAKHVQISDYPRYSRAPDSCNMRICHIGVGGFHRAHQANYLHQLLQQGGGQGWGIYGIALMPNDLSLYSAMQTQDKLYSLWELEGEEREVRIIGSIIEFVNAINDREPAISAISHPDTRIVSLTITEKGYCLDASGELDLTHPDITQDIALPEKPTSAIGLIVRALMRRRDQDLPPVTVMSCDNLIANGEQARKAIIGLARAIDTDLAAWIQAHVSFPLSMVDRITPRPKSSTCTQLANSVGIEDQCLLVCESWKQWILEDNFCNGRPAFERAGVTITDSVHLYEAMKVSMLNGGHSALSHIGILLSYQRVDEAASDPDLQQWLNGYMQEVEETLISLPGINFAEYRQSLISRFANSAIEDSLFRLAEDSSSKFQQCLLEPLRKRFHKKEPCPYIAAAITIWIIFLDSISDQDELLCEYKDSNTTRLLKLASETKASNDPTIFLVDILNLEGECLDYFAAQVNAVLTGINNDICSLRSWIREFNLAKTSSPIKNAP
ncbi:mannitol dehydrogenase family protein [uncultured Zhongshania sp.]|uniref:mannitol dehydrogenase family protein n=1 Tax=uncultured Zhongshania sp. TaxID=1642288 RepID=UPI0030DC87B0|tara:strand:+ start:2863 stop:4383 length:1521 start_codon:yes stop_codon:yes gene_type:complete